WEHTFVNRLPPDATVVDLGASVGGFARALLASAPGAQLILVEANPRLARKLKRAFLDRAGVRVVNAAIGARSRKDVHSSFVRTKKPARSSGVLPTCAR